MKIVIFCLGFLIIRCINRIVLFFIGIGKKGIVVVYRNKNWVFFFNSLKKLIGFFKEI